MPLKVLFLDDEPALCEIFTDELASADIQITTFTDSAQAIEFASKEPPDLIFLDNRLPGTTGNQVAHAMAAHIPKYLLTGDIDVKSTYPFAAIFTKPCDFEQIRAVLNRFSPDSISSPGAAEQKRDS